MAKLTAKEIAERYKVDKRAAQVWIQKGLFPNAVKDLVPGFGEIWRVPESDLVNFVQPKAGRPKSKI